MSKLTIKDVIILVFIVALFIILLAESSSFEKEMKMNAYDDYVSKYTGAINQINYIKINDYTMAQKYLSDFVDTVENNREEAYGLIDSYYKNNSIPTLSDFNRKMDIIDSKVFLDAKVEKYSIKYDKKIKYFFIEDAAGNIFVFKEKNIMDYTVYLDAITLDL